MTVRITALRLRSLLPAQREAQQANTPVGDAGGKRVPVSVPMQALREDDALRLPTDPEEALWLARARQGDVAAFEWLMNRYRDRAIRLATHILRRPTEAEDVAQEAFIRAFAQIRNFRGDAAFYSWLYTIVARLCLNRMRQPRWFREWESAKEEQAYTGGAGMEKEEQYAERLLIESVLDQLSPPLRAALALRELEGMDYDEIAFALNIPVGTVRSRLNAARGQFRTLWERALKEAANV